MNINPLSYKKSLGIKIALFTCKFIKKIANETIRHLTG